MTTLPIIPSKYLSSYFDSVNPTYNRAGFSGYNGSVPSSGIYDISDCAQNFDYTVTTATTLSVVSTSVNDTSAGTGIRTISIMGLDQNYNEISEVLTLNGLTPVITVNSYLRINNVVNLSHGSLLSADGDITGTAGSIEWFHISAGNTNARLGRYTVPAGFTLVLDSVGYSSGKSDEFLVTINTKLPGFAQLRNLAMIVNDKDLVIAGYPATLPEKTDLWIQAEVVSGTGSKAVTCYMSGIIVNHSEADTRYPN